MSETLKKDKSVDEAPLHAELPIPEIIDVLTRATRHRIKKSSRNLRKLKSKTGTAVLINNGQSHEVIKYKDDGDIDYRYRF